MISIAMATYNGEKYIREQLDSILNQSVKDFELIVCDDCSKDSTVKILNEYAAKDSRIKLFINKTNLGYVQNFLQALKLCSGKWIFLSDQDDIWGVNKIECFMDVIRSKNDEVNMIVSDFDNFPVDNSIKFFKSSKKVIPISFKKCVKVCSFAGMSMCINQKVVPVVLGNGIENHIFHDWEISLISSHGKDNKCYFLNLITAHHRIHENNASVINENNSSKQSIYDIRKKHLERKIQLFEYALKINCLSKSEKSLLKNVFFYFSIRKKILIQNNIFKLFMYIPKAFFMAFIVSSVVKNSILILCRDLYISLLWNVKKI